jgi:hypothetical protein
MTDTAAPAAPRFRVGQKVSHSNFGIGRIVAVYAIAQAADEETEYIVKLRGDRYPATLGEHGLTAA